MDQQQAHKKKSRDFICSCGKNYLSYAALFTHIKQKHDGKAPGPIIRPRSQRKRGRPRKNHPLDLLIHHSHHTNTHQLSYTHKNRISIINEINNNNNCYYYNHIKSFQNQRKKAAELLGCGQFKGFRSYNPQLHSFFKLKHPKQPQKKLGFKQYISDDDKPQLKISKQSSHSDNQPIDKIHSNPSTPISNQDTHLIDQSCLYNFVILHIKTLFQGYQFSQQQEKYNQIIQMLDWIGQQITQTKDKITLKIYNSINNTPIQNGFLIFIKLLQKYLKSNQLKQITFLLSLFYQHIKQDTNHNPTSPSLDLSLTDSTKYIASFLNNYLPTKIKQLQIGYLHILNAHNPANIMLAFCNWIALHEIQDGMIINTIYNNPSSQMQVFNLVSQQKHQPNQSLSQSSSQQDIKFQQINYVFDQLQRNTIINNSNHKCTNNNQIQSDASYLSESLNSDSSQIEKSSQNVKHLKDNQPNIMVQHR